MRNSEKNTKGRKLNAAQLKDYNNLTASEKKIYDSLLRHFPATSHESAYEAALNGGVNWQAKPWH